MVGTLVRGCSCAMSWSDLDLTVDLAVVTLTYKILWCSCATSWCDLDLSFDLAVVILTHKILSGLYLRNRKV